MRKLFAAIIGLLVSFLPLRADEPLFPYPEAPDDLETTQARCDYVIEHFWDRCNLKQAFSSLSKLNTAFNDFISIMPLADIDVARSATEKLIDNVKKNPDHLLTLAQMAEGIMYSDTAKIGFDEIYVHFANAVAENKKIKSADKARFAAQAKILNSSQVGMKAPDILMTLSDGTKKHLDEITGAYIILFFNDPDCNDCMMARVRLAADYNINQFIKRGQLRVVSIYPGEPSDEEWTSSLSLLPDNWIIGASPDADMVYDMRRPPVIYYLNRDHTILSKSMTADQLINAFRVINTRQAE